ncbi:UNVERIFIED_CONTAM: Serine/threonine-protein phosphatase 7 long form [Sesamum radiatum]|uniref:Serine/threonine-protein phosphatase 7 long form n=1 Tax=Sesamum radiatum TaxID=300843 RepID=A0AAW2RGH9_SESRA
MGFLGVLQCGHIEIDTHLITALVERWRPETHTFHFSVGEATITLQDIAVIWALPVEGNTVSLLYLRHMENIDEESTSNWGTAVLAYLYRELCTASQRGKTNIGGAMQLLQIWAWSRIITLAPIPSNNVADLMPTIDDPENILPVPPYARRWSYHISQTHTAHNAIRIIRNTLDRMQENEFIWTPYLHGLPELQSLPAYATRTPWNIRCPLINYSIVEMHHVERVLRQFGMIQDIPPNPLVSERRLHQIDRRGRRGEDWVAFHRDYILKWNDVHSLIVVRPDVGNGRGTVPDYMNWSINVYTEAGPSNVYTVVYTEAGPSNVYTPAGPSNVYTEAGPSNVYTPPQSFNIYANAQRHLGISPVPFEGSELNTPVDERQVHPPQRNRRRPRCGTGDICSG